MHRGDHFVPKVPPTRRVSQRVLSVSHDGDHAERKGDDTDSTSEAEGGAPHMKDASSTAGVDEGDVTPLHGAAARSWPDNLGSQVKGDRQSGPFADGRYGALA